MWIGRNEFEELKKQFLNSEKELRKECDLLTIRLQSLERCLCVEYVPPSGRSYNSIDIYARAYHTDGILDKFRCLENHLNLQYIPQTNEEKPSHYKIMNNKNAKNH